MYAGALIAIIALGIFVQGFQLWSLTLIVVALLALNALGLRRAFDRVETIAPGYAGLILALFSVWLFVSAHLSELDSLTRIGLYQQLTLPLAFLAYLLAPDKALAWRWIIRFSGAACVGLAVAALAEPVYREVPTLSASFVQRNSLSGFLLLLTFILLPALERALAAAVNRRRAIVIWSVPIFLSLFVVSFSTSRAAIGALVVAFGGFYLSGGRHGRNGLGKYVLALALWAFLLADVALQGDLGQSVHSVRLVSAQLIGARDGLLDDEFSVVSDRETGGVLPPLLQSKVSSANERLLIWRATLNMVEDLPWSGFGPGTFRAVYPSFGFATDRSSRNYAHNDYLQIYAELGICGLALCALLAGVVAWRWTRLFRQRHRSEGYMESNALFWGMVGVGGQSVFTYNFYVPATLMVLGLVLARFGLATADQQSSRSIAPFRGFRRPSVIFILLVLTSIPTITLISATATAMFHERGMAALNAGLLAEAEALLSMAARLNPNATTEAARAHLYLAAFTAQTEAQKKRSYFALAEEHAARAQAMNRYSAEVAYTQMLLAIHDARFDERARVAAIAARYRETMRRDHRYFPARIELARFLQQRGRGQRARAILEAGLRHPIPGHPLVVDYLTLLRDLRKETGDAAGARAADKELRRIQELVGAAS